MGEDELQEAQEEKLEAETYSILFHDGIISAEEYAAAMDMKFTGDGIIKQRQSNVPNQGNA